MKKKKLCPVCGGTDWRMCTPEENKLLDGSEDNKYAYKKSIYCNHCEGYFSIYDLK